jgi:predicted RNA-binding Zn ribbon-like protein
MTVDNPAVEASHAHWDMFDMSFEGSRYAALQAILEETTINVAAAEALREEIVQFCDLTGYGDADGFYADTAHMSAAEIEESDIASSRRIMLFDRFADGDYFAAHAQSADLLKTVSRNEATLTFIRELQEATRQSYITGRDRKTSEVEALSLTSPTL